MRATTLSPTAGTTGAGSAPVVRVSNLVKNYGDVPAVTSVSLTADRGEALVLLGPSGCGKTTLLRCIAGLERVNSGNIEISGRTVAATGIDEPPERRNIGMVFQSYALWPNMSVLGNVAFALRQQSGMTKAASAARAHEVLDRLGVGMYANRRPTELSGGQRQRVALARALAAEPPLLLMDEPLSALDPLVRQHLRVELRRLLVESGITCIYVTHDQDEALAVGDRIAIMQSGRIVDEASPRDLFNRPATTFSAQFLGARNSVSGTVQSTTPDGSYVATVGACRLGFQAGRGLNFEPGDPVTICWRPDAMGVAASTETESPQFVGEVVGSVLLRHGWEVEVDSPAFGLTAGFSQTNLQPGDLVHLRPEPTGIIGYRVASP